MNRGLVGVFVVVLGVVSLVVVGCKGKVEKPQAPAETSAVMPEAAPQAPAETVAVPEPAQNVAVETIPPSAAPQGSEKPAQPPAATFSGVHSTHLPALGAEGISVCGVSARSRPWIPSTRFVN